MCSIFLQRIIKDSFLKYMFNILEKLRINSFLNEQLEFTYYIHVMCVMGTINDDDSEWWLQWLLTVMVMIGSDDNDSSKSEGYSLEYEYHITYTMYVVQNSSTSLIHAQLFRVRQNSICKLIFVNSIQCKVTHILTHSFALMA